MLSSPLQAIAYFVCFLVYRARYHKLPIIKVNCPSTPRMASEVPIAYSIYTADSTDPDPPFTTAIHC